MSAISLENLSKMYTLSGGPVRALDNVNLRVDKGTIQGIIGFSGSGKTKTNY